MERPHASFVAHELSKRTAPRRRSANHLDDIAEVQQQLRPFPPHDP
jgi:hypothetical protein